MSRRGLASLTVLSGSISASVSKWFLVWLFAQSAGGTEAVGIYSAILAIATPLFIVAQLGLRTIFLSSMTKWPWGTYWRLRAFGTAVGAGLFALVLFLVPGLSISIGLAILALKIADSILDIYLARLQYANRMLHLGLLVTASALVTMVAAALVVGVTGQVTHGVAIAALVSCCTGLWARAAGRTTPYRTEVKESGTGEILRASFPVTTSQFLASLLFQLPVMTLTLATEPHAVGVYAAAAYLLTAASLFGSTLQTLLITPLRRLRERHGPSRLKRYTLRITLYTLAAGGILSIGVVTAGSPALQALYGQDFALDPWSLTNLAIAATGTVGAFVLSVALQVMNRYRAVMWAMGSSCLISIIVGVILIGFSTPPLLIGTGMATAGATARLIFMIIQVRRA